MTEFLSNFHLLRPWLLLAIVPAVILFALLWFQRRRATQWQDVIDAPLLKYLLDGSRSKQQRWPLPALLTGWIIAVIALAGPTWEQLPTPVLQSQAATVILWDMSPSMLAEDNKPSRLVQSQFKLIDFLKAHDEGVAALVAYAGEAYVVSPLTDDTETIINLAPALNPGMMPLPGSNIEMAVGEAVKLFKEAKISQGNIIALSDGITPLAFDSIRQQLAGSRHSFSIWGIGSEQGAPIPRGRGGFEKDAYGDIVIAKLNSAELKPLASELNGAFVSLRADDSDILALMALNEHNLEAEAQRDQSRRFDAWEDKGPWLALALLPLIALAFRRGLVVCLAIVVILPSQYSEAAPWWDNLWQTPNQQASKKYRAGDTKTAARLFDNEQWRGSANYRSDNFDAAIKDFRRGTSAVDKYNLGNALAKAGRLEEALKAYDEALKLQPDFPEARANNKIVEEVLEQEKQKKQQQGDQQSNSEQQQDGDSEQAQNQSGDSGDDNQQGEDGQQSQQQDSAEQQAANQNDDNGEEQQNQQAQQQEQNQNSKSAQTPQRAEAQDGTQETAGVEPEAGEVLSEEDLEQLALQRAEDAQEGEEEIDSPFSDPNLTAEERQALEQWLRQVPNDPSGLLRRKFQYQQQQQRRAYQMGLEELPENGAYERW